MHVLLTFEIIIHDRTRVIDYDDVMMSVMMPSRPLMILCFLLQNSEDVS